MCDNTTTTDKRMRFFERLYKDRMSYVKTRNIKKILFKQSIHFGQKHSESVDGSSQAMSI